MKKIGLFSLLLALVLAVWGLTATSLGEGVEVVAFSVGKADALLIRTEAGAILLDAGTDDVGEDLVLRLKQLGVDRLDALIVSHFDKDHIGGADAVLRNIPVGRVIQPEGENDSKQFKQYAQAAAEAGLVPEEIAEEVEMELAALTMTLIPAERAEYHNDFDNNISLVLRFQYGEIRFLFTGDVEEERIAELLERQDLQAQVFKVPHHGRLDALSGALFEKVSADVAIICCSQEEPEDDEIVDMLRDLNTQIHTTRTGEIRVTTDGQKIEVGGR